ncbi:tetratricopeptide repeat protein 23 isoform X5 [Octodon degus]|uniref:Tetratricopeptide repeat protein 23 isoform X5 n=1 Tax=Octodon degus TaxID=10160 RepID=A0A6P6E0P8_OCTDE|nr:tetratricopeptide repeat protein 23 isoform X5 [Octodon degus]
MQESEEIHISSHLDEVVAAVSISPRKKVQSQLPQTVLFQPPREKLHLCEEKAKSYLSSHQYKQAVPELVRCVALTRICYGDCHWKLAEAHVNLAQGYLQMKGFSLQAKQHAEKAKEILTDFIVPPYSDNTDVFKCSVELFHTMGRAYLSLQKFKDASENLVKAEKLSKELLQCGRIIKEEWIEAQARIKLSFAQLSSGSKRAAQSYQSSLTKTNLSDTCPLVSGTPISTQHARCQGVTSLLTFSCCLPACRFSVLPFCPPLLPAPIPPLLHSERLQWIDLVIRASRENDPTHI